MAISKVTKINIIGCISEREAIIKAIQELGLVQVVENNHQLLKKANAKAGLIDADHKLAGINFCLNFLAEYDNKKKSFKSKINPAIEISEDKLAKVLNSFDLEETIKKVQEVQGVINELKNTISKSNTEISIFKPWEKLNFIPQKENLSENINFKFLAIPLNTINLFEKEIQAKIKLFDLSIVDRSSNETLASFIYNTEYESLLLEILNQHNVRQVELPEINTSVSAYLTLLEKKIVECEKALFLENVKARKLTSRINELKIAHDYYYWQRERFIALQKTSDSTQFFSITGWTENQSIKKIKNTLLKRTNNFHIYEIEKDEDEVEPIAFKNNSWVAPFEFVTNVYGAPKNGSPDPTPFLAPFFVVFFGLCLTDAGYGIVLFLLSLIALKIFKPDKEGEKTFLVFVYAGLMTFLAGAFVGGWFGITIDTLSWEWLRNILTNLRIIDPVKDPIGMLIFSLSLGVIQVLVGIIISIWWKVKNKNIKSALLDDAVWLYFLLSILLWGANSSGLISIAFSEYLVWVGVLGIIITQGRKAKNPLLKLGQGILSLYGIVGYLSDVLSYSRLLALGLATGIIAMVVNLIAFLAIDMVPYFGYVIAFVVIIGGHTFNLAINALGAFIHASRLQFVEFFPKFMEGGGISLAPMKKESKYLKIIK